MVMTLLADGLSGVGSFVFAIALAYTIVIAGSAAVLWYVASGSIPSRLAYGITALVVLSAHALALVTGVWQQLWLRGANRGALLLVSPLLWMTVLTLAAPLLRWGRAHAQALGGSAPHD